MRSDCPPRLRLPAVIPAALTFLALIMAAMPAQAGSRYPTGRGGPDYVDPVTGYICVTPFCDLLRLPQSNCLCQKENPGERRLTRLRLTCSTREAGAWVACPVKPRYGISTN